MNKKHQPADLRTAILKLLEESKKSSLAPAQILSGLDLERQDKSIVLSELKNMLGQGLVIKDAGGHYGLPGRLGCLTGVLQGNRKGFAFLMPDGRKDEDVFISAANLRDAAHGDRVVVRVDPKRGRRRREGTVVGIIKRGRKRLVGTMHREGKKLYVTPDDRRFSGVVQVNRRNLHRAEPGDTVVVEVEKWGLGRRPAKGTIVERIGPAGAPRTSERAFDHRFDLPGDFPPGALKALESFSPDSDLEQLVRGGDREDLRGLKMVTIDDEQARDFDDAVSLEPLPGDKWRLGVHIADVSHYVRAGKALDREALKRGTSIYLADRVIHMLPPLLSENLCSLQADRDRLAVSVFMDIDSAGDLDSARFSTSLIRVAERLTYRQVEAYLAGQNESNGDPGKKAPGSQAGLFRDEDLPGMLSSMDLLAGLLRRRRMERGALDLDLPEARVEIDATGEPLSIEKRRMGRSESLIEEFMIYCNETVAAHLAGRQLPCLFRVHAVPTEEKLALLRETLTLMNIRAAAGIKVLKPQHLRSLLEKTRGEKAERLVRYLTLRTLPQAIYSAYNDGHFGLASGCYCHFTSPIRRYPDLVVHRILKEHLSPAGLSGEKKRRLDKRLPAVARQASERERAAVEAERMSLDMKKAHYMEKKIGETFPGIISGVTNFGLFVELDNTVEGMIPLGELSDDYYVYHERTASLVGERSRRTYRLGDPINIRVSGASREEGRVTFALEEN